jgi:hypothetical protein
LSAVPEIEVDGILYREFSLDANDTGNDDYMSIDDIRIFLDEQVDLGGFVPATDIFGTNEDADAAVKVYDLEIPVLMRSQGFTPGSGVSDITVLVPSSVFETVTTDCSYGSPTCDQWIYFYFVAGDLDPTTLTGLPPTLEDRDWDVTAGFEEWRTRFLPVVNVEKTANPSLTRSYDWTLDKQVSIDDGATWVDDDSVDLFVGDSQDYLWRLVADRSNGTDSSQQVSGTITITNPTGPGGVITEPITATIKSLSDVLTLDGTPQDVTPVCPVSFPYELDAGDSIVCTYSVPVTETDDGENVATAIVESDLGDLEYSGSADVDWSLATVNEVDESATFSDPEVPDADGQTILDDGTFTSSTQNFECGVDTLISNTATLTEDDSGTIHNDTSTLDVDCHELTVEKDATTSFDTAYDWTLDKQVSIDDGATWMDDEATDLFIGDSQDYLWRLVATRLDPVSSGWAVAGTITITNTTPIDATGVAVSDVLSISGAADVDCDPVAAGNQTIVDVAGNGGTAECTYTKSLGAATDQTNTATATLFGHDVTGQAAVDFSTATVTETDETATLSDPEVLLSDEGLLDSGTFTGSTQNYECGEDTLISNTADLTEDDTSTVRTDTATLDVDCHELTVEKDANTSYTTSYDWTLDKQVSIDDGATWVDSATVDINQGESQDYLWRLVATRLDGVDSDWAVSGTITITNPTPIDATGITVSDMLSISGPADVDCDPVAAGNQSTVDVTGNGGSAECTYSKSLAGATDQTNTATASLFGHDVTGQANVDFSTATVTEVDETATLSDPEVLAGDEVLLDSGTFESSTQNYLCGGSVTMTNTGDLTEDDTSTLHQDTADLTVNCIAVSESCTPGFWQGGNGIKLWDSPTDQLAIDLGLSLQAAGYGNGEPFYTGENVATFFGPSGLDGTTLLGVVGTGGTNNWERKAMRDLIAALLNAEDNEINYPSTVGEVMDDWAAAVAAGVPGYKAFHSFYGAQNSDIGLGCDRSNDVSQLGLLVVPFLLLGGEVWRRRRGRHEA